mgnify:CR=1 FL=1
MPSEDKSQQAVSHVIFDMDGLLLDSETCYETAYATVVGRFGHRLTYDVKSRGKLLKSSSENLISSLFYSPTERRPGNSERRVPRLRVLPSTFPA